MKVWTLFFCTLWLLLVVYFNVCTRAQNRKCVRIADVFFWPTCILCPLPVPSRLALGVEDRRIPDGGFSASSSWNRNHGPKRARLNIPRRGRLTGAWCARSNNRAQWLLVDITKLARVVGFAVQGRQDYSQWVTSLRISYSKGGIYFRYYTERRRPKVCLQCSLLLCWTVTVVKSSNVVSFNTHWKVIFQSTIDHFRRVSNKLKWNKVRLFMNVITRIDIGSALTFRRPRGLVWKRLERRISNEKNEE